jgi:hypothetical protein
MARVMVKAPAARAVVPANQTPTTVRVPTIWTAVAPNSRSPPEWTTEWTSSYESSDDQAKATGLAVSKNFAPSAATRRTEGERVAGPFVPVEPIPS